MLFLTFTGCKQPKQERNIERSFYFWKSAFNIPANEISLLDSLHVKTLYIKYFDVDWDDDAQMPLPKATLRIAPSGKALHFNIVPCIFITNECIKKLDSSIVPQLAQNITKLVAAINADLRIKNTEVQIDCDWTAGTRTVYFKLLEQLHKQLSSDSTTASAKLSATIRLYQVKYLMKTGVPPVDRGMLMAYNMGNLRDPSSKNSILETKELNKYIGYLNDYPLELDVALPVFQWAVLFRENSFAGLIQDLPTDIYSGDIMKKLSGNRFQIIADTTISGYTFKAGDVLRIEDCKPGEILSAGEAINKQLRNKKLRLSLFHLDSITLSKYSFHEMETFFSCLN